MQHITGEFIRTLAAANGIAISDAQLEPVRQQFESFMRTVTEIEAVPLAPEVDPAVVFGLAPAAMSTPENGR